MPSISILIPTHNRADLIRETLDSVAAQTFPDWECVIVDDSSTDQTRAVVEEYQAHDPRFRYVWHDSALGSRDEKVVAVRNFALTLASGEFVAFLDDDDLWLPEYLATVLEPMQRPSCVLAAAARLFWDGERILETQRFKVQEMDNPLRAQIRWTNLVPSQCLMRRSALDRTAKFRLLGSEDYDLWLQLMPLGNSALLNAPLVKYRVHAGSSLLDPTGEKRRRLAYRHMEVLQYFLRRQDISLYDRFLAMANIQRKREQLLVFDLEEGRVPSSRLVRLARLLAIVPSPLLRSPALARQYLRYSGGQQ